MRTVVFGDKDSYGDYGLIRTNATIGAPQPKTYTVDIEGADGSLDLTEYFGEVLYENREIEIEFNLPPGEETRQDAYGAFFNDVHGRRLKVAFSEDPDFYWIGRCTVSDWETAGAVGEISVTIDAEPYKYKKGVTEKTFQVSGTSAQTFENLRKRVVPTFTLGAAMQIVQGSQSFSASQGTWSDSDLYFVQGTNQLTFNGTGSVTVRWQERGL